MRRLITISFTIILATLSFFAQSSGETAVRTVSSVDLKKYSGTWFEIAKYPNKFQKQCIGNTTATYTMKGEGKLEILNSCLKKDGTTEASKGAGKIEDKPANAKLKVRFASAFTSFLSSGWTDFWVIDLANDYSYAAVGTPKRDYFWILSRTPELKDDIYQGILRRAEQQGFVPGKVEKTPQGVETGKGSVLNQG